MTRVSQLDAFEDQVDSQTGKAMTTEEARSLTTLGDALK